MLSELFTPVETPEAPNRGFFKGLFGGGAQSLDREDLCECYAPQPELTFHLVSRVSVVVVEFMRICLFLLQSGKPLLGRRPGAWLSTSLAPVAWRA